MPAVLIAALLLTTPQLALAAPDAETAFILNSLSFLMHGFLVMIMAAGFCLLEAGLVRTKNVTVQCTKNIGLFAIATLTYWLLGYNLMYQDVTSFMGSFGLWSAEDPAVIDGVFVAGNSYSVGSDWFFQMLFVGKVASIVSGAVAERIKLPAFLVFSAIFTALVYPIQGAWSWGGGFLAEAGFVDFAGSTIVHSVGGWAALTGIIILGARKGKYPAGGGVKPMPGSNLPMATIGTFLLWFGWFGFNGGSQLAMDSAANIIAISTIYNNSTLAASAGAILALVLTKVLYGKIDLTMTLNGALGGLVAITAEPLSPTPMLAVFIGSVGAALVVITVPLLDKMKIDDVVGAVPVHLVAGIWGTFAVLLSNPDATFTGQLLGVVSVAIFVIVCSCLIWYGLKYTIGLRADAEDEYEGLDLSECGLEAYPEFPNR